MRIVCIALAGLVVQLPKVGEVTVDKNGEVEVDEITGQLLISSPTSGWREVKELVTEDESTEDESTDENLAEQLGKMSFSELVETAVEAGVDESKYKAFIAKENVAAMRKVLLKLMS